MKKLLGMTLALAMFVPAGANAELLKNFKVSGNLDIQTTSARNVRDFVTRADTFPANPATQATGENNDRLGHANTRVIVKMDWDLLDDVHSRVTLVKGAWNNDSNAGARSYGQASQSVQTLIDKTFIEEANVKIDKVMDLLDLTAGRQFYGEEGDLIVYYGPRDNYGLRVDALDAFRADWNGEHMSVTGIAGKTLDSNVTTVENTTAVVAADLRGVVVSCKMHEMIKPSLYIYNAVQHAVGSLGSVLGKNTNLWVAGVKAKFTAGGLTASAELAKNFGEDRTTAQNSNFKGYAVLGKAAFKLDLQDLGAITPWGEFGWGTGDSNGVYAGNRTFQAINTDYRPGGIYGRFDNGSAVPLGGAVGTFGASSNGLANRLITGLGVKVTPAAVAKLTVGAAYWKYAFDRLADNGTTPAQSALPSRNSRNIGSEFDVTAEWKHSENVSFKGMAGSFLPGTYVKDVKAAGAGLNPVVMLSGDVSIKF